MTTHAQLSRLFPALEVLVATTPLVFAAGAWVAGAGQPWQFVTLAVTGAAFVVLAHLIPPSELTEDDLVGDMPAAQPTQKATPGGGLVSFRKRDCVGCA